MRASGFRIPAEVVAILRGAAGGGDGEPDAEPDGGGQAGGKYLPLTRWLQEQTADAIPVTCAGLEEVIDEALAPSARNHLPYWYSVRNSLGRAIAAGGFRPRRVNLASETLTLVRR